MLHTKPLVEALKTPLIEAVRALKTPPHMAAVLVGNDGPSLLYQNLKKQFIESIGARYTLHHLPENTSQQALHSLLNHLNADDTLHGIILQLPLPEGLDPTAALNVIDASKDIDGLTEASWKGLLEKNPRTLLPATPLGVLRILAWADIDLNGISAVVVGRSRLVGGPLAELLRQQGAAITTFSQEDPIQDAVIQQADLIVSAAGCAGLIRPSMVKQGATVIDVGINALTHPDGTRKIVGDAVTEDLKGVAGYLTPVPGGVGRMTVLSLVTNLIDAASMQQGQPRPTWTMPSRL